MENNKKFKGLGGWLILIRILLLLAPVVYFIISIFWGYGILGFYGWRDYVPVVIAFLAFITGIFHMDLLDKFYARRSTFPPRAVFALWLPPTYALLYTRGTQLLTTGFLIYLILGVVATDYLLRSKRVKNTFVN